MAAETAERWALKMKKNKIEKKRSIVCNKIMGSEDLSLECVEQLVGDLCYVFPAFGMKDLCFSLHKDDGSAVRFAQKHSYVEFPRNGFYQLDSDPKRYRKSYGIYASIMKSPLQIVPAELSVVQAFVSVAHANRSIRESDLSYTTPKEYGWIMNSYENAIRLSGDDSAVKILNLIGSRPDTVMFCSTDCEVSSLLPEPVRMIVSEAFAGLALCAMHEGRVIQSVGYGTAALFKHHGALPMVNCSRLVAAVRRDVRAVLYLTEMVVIPFYLQTKNDALYQREIDLWGAALAEVG